MIGHSSAPLALVAIVEHHETMLRALRDHFGGDNLAPGTTPSERRADLARHARELDITSAFTTIATMEAWFRVDYLYRVARRPRGALTLRFREIDRAVGPRARFDDHLLVAWVEVGSARKRTIADIRSALRFRHWVAHGRYWTARFGRVYDFDTMLDLARRVEVEFPFKA